MKRFTSKTQQLGEKGEEYATMFLMKHEYSIVGRNSANKYGEIDIVAKKKGMYYFFEVKAGRKGTWFNPAENLTKAKLRKLIISVEYYCLTCNIREYRVQGIIVLLPYNENEEVNLQILDIS